MSATTMPTVGGKRALLSQTLDKTYSLHFTADDEFQSLCFQFGLEHDKVTTEKQMITKEQGAEQSCGASEEIVYGIDIPTIRYDLLCLEGLVTGLQIFQENVNELGMISPILRDVTLDQASYNSFIDRQDKLHQNICRTHSLVSIGTHDLNTFAAPFTYDAKAPSDICFKPLHQKKEYAGSELMELYAVKYIPTKLSNSYINFMH